ncbi:hypothetical protein V7161_26525 [Neobacillus drentensis]|uniref:hypothetical protein n=1 Tax=Neobacillus drentensis TaxID=220684 RepID=UPI0030023E10
MKKLLISNMLLMVSFLYVVFRVTDRTLYLQKISVMAENPVSIHWNSIAIDTGFIQDKFGHSMPGSIYFIWMTPIYIFVFVAIILTLLAFKKKK